MATPSRFDWFADWAASHVLLTLTAVRGPGIEELLTALDASEVDRGACTHREAMDLDLPAVRVGTAQGWTYAVELSSVRGGDPAVLQRLTAGGGEAVTACLTATVQGLHHARDGEYVVGFDLVLPSFRWGREPHSLDREMAAAGLLDEDGPRPVAACADILERAFGLTVTRDVLERRLLCATLGG
ncbi:MULTISPECIES: DUF6461 domain-containing protein [unclassified Geodermatophilus]|uniref:DUF6461 domain-containing protein n=1 Tax=unclassified Geodermatophilus TaxID=2637632 RepID=UPI003EEB6771